MYVVKRTVKGKDYYSLRKSVREDGKVKSKFICYLGKDKNEAYKKAVEVEERIKNGEDVSGFLKSSGNVSVIDDYERTEISIEDLANFCKDKGFCYRSSDIYGGYSGFWDFGPLGVELFNNIKKDWWDFFVRSRDNIVGMEASVISHPKTWEASGHVSNFNDLMIFCKKNNNFFRADHLIEDVLGLNVEGKNKDEILDIFLLKRDKFINAGYILEDELKTLNLMFKTGVGALSDEVSYLRGETAQGMFLDFKLIMQTSRMKLPFGIAQIGRCFRNEIAPRDFLFRSREFHIGEFEFFINKDEKECDILTDVYKGVRIKLLDSETQVKDSTELRETTIGEMLNEGRLEPWHAYWLSEQVLWFNSIGLTEIKIREHMKDELSHYSSATFDIDYEYSFGSKEVAGNANRGQYDLGQHEKSSGISMKVFDEKYKNKEIPRVIEPTFGMERVFLGILTKAYCYDKNRDNVILRIPGKLAPIKAAVFPIVKQPEYIEMSENIVRLLRSEFNVVYDKSGSIGRRYSRNDSIGTPYCITIDEKSIEGKDVTIRDRDTTLQIRVKVKDLLNIIKRLINKEINFKSAGKLVETRVKEEVKEKVDEVVKEEVKEEMNEVETEDNEKEEKSDIVKEEIFEDNKDGK
ncbi:glycine--tRNA ligase [Candidatus Pacearchaeota archaeon]|nr:glycine--tRNA ligase [Candidatus Pacearchaeota archaeon]